MATERDTFPGVGNYKRQDTFHRGVSAERGCSAFRFRIIPHLGKAELNFQNSVPTRPAAQPRCALPVGSRDSHHRGREAACAVQGLGCRARSPTVPRPRAPSPRPRSPSSSSLTSRAAFSPSSRRLRSIILLRSTAALSSALSVQPMVAERRRALGAGAGWQHGERLARRRPRYVRSSGKLEARSASSHAAAPGGRPRRPATLRDQHLSPLQPPLLLLPLLLLLPVAEPLQLTARASPASARRRGPAPARPATTPRARSRPPSRARALGQRPLRRPRARVVAAPGASRACPRGAQRSQPSQATAGCHPAPIPHLLRSATGISAYLSLMGADGTVAKVASKKRKAGLGI